MRIREMFSSPKVFREKVAQERLAQNAEALEKFYAERGFVVPVKEFCQEMLKDSKVKFDHGVTRGGGFDVISKELHIPGGTDFLHDHLRVHELAHATSKWFTDVDADAHAGRMIAHSGFGFDEGLVHDDKVQKTRLFSALNEAMASEISSRVLTRHLSRFARFIEKGNTGRNPERHLLAFVIRNIASAGNAKEEEVFDTFLESFLHGWTRTLKDNLRVTFGPHALKVLAIIDTHRGSSSERRSLRNPFVTDNAYIFFDIARSEDERKRAAQKLLAAFDPKHYAEDTREVRLEVGRKRRENTSGA